MESINRYQNQEYLRGDQYKTSNNLGDRAQLHRRFSSNSLNWENWIFSYLELRPGFTVLECGSGPGWLWQNNLDQIPAECTITVSDLSPGMVAEAQKKLAIRGLDFKFEEADIMNLPFGDDSYNVVVANHMLYHVADRDKALSEVKRVLKPNGFLIATTIGKGHMHELHELANQLAPEFAKSFNRFDSLFSLENGRAQLESWFEPVELYLYESELKVTEVEPLLAYAMSSSEIRALVDEKRVQLAALHLAKIIQDRGAFTISTNTGLFRAKCNKLT